jgi:hypothetical protein
MAGGPKQHSGLTDLRTTAAGTVAEGR